MTLDAVGDAGPRILIVRPSALGDVAKTVPALVTLRLALPDAHIAWLVNDTFADVVSHHPALDELFLFPRQRFGQMFRNPSATSEAWAWARRLRQCRFDMAIDLQGLFRSGLFTLLTGAHRRIGMAQAREMASLAYNHRHRVEGPHVVDRMLALLGAEGFPVHHDMRLHLGENDRQWLEDYCREHVGAAQPYATMAPTANWLCKCWPLDRYVETAVRLLDSKRVGERLVILASPQQRGYVQPLLERIGRRAHCPTTTVGQLMALLSRTSLLICNDSAPLHLAVGFHRPIVAIFGPTDPRLVGPYRRDETVVQASPVKVNYRRQRHDQSLISQVTVEMVWARVLEQLAATGG